MKRVLILQNKILHYRKSLYNELSKYYDITVLHSGSVSVSNDDLYHEIVTKSKKIGPFILQSNVLKEVKSDKYDIVISMFDLRWINNILAMYMHNKNIKFIWWGAWFTNNFIANKIRLYLASKKYACIFYTADTRDSFIKKGISKHQLFVANNTFNVDSRVKSYKNEIKTSILFVGSLDKRKQNDILINAFANIKDTIPNEVNLVIVGDGIEKNNLYDLVKKLQLEDRVFFEGKITDTNILVNYYKEAVVSVSFGQAGLSVLQSLGYGVPFLTKSNAISGGEKTNIKHGINGLFCDDDVKSLEKHLVEVCANIEYARKLGKNAYDYYSEFCTIENMAQGFRDAIENTRLAKLDSKDLI